MRFRLFATLGVFASSLIAQVESPRIATVRYPNGAVHAVYGLKDSYVVGSRIAADVKAAAFSERFGLIATGQQVELVQADGKVVATATADDPALELDIPGEAETATVWLPASGVLLRWSGTKFVAAPASYAPEPEYKLAAREGKLAVTAGERTAEFPFPQQPFQCERAARHLLHLSSNGQHWLLSLGADGISLSELPPPRSSR